MLSDEVFDSAVQLDETLWAATDHMGSVNDLLDSSEAIVEHREYNSFGELDAAFDALGNDITGTTLQSDIGYTGKVFDSTTGLQNNSARWYDPHSGRFLSEDPIQEGANWYAYAGNDPVNFRDPTGLSQAGNPLNALAGGFGGNVVARKNTALRNLNFGPVRSSIPASAFSTTSLLNQLSVPSYVPSARELTNFGSLANTGPITQTYAAPNLAPSRSSSPSLRSQQLASVDYGLSLIRQNPIQTGSYVGDFGVQLFTELGATVERARIGLATHFRADTQRERVDGLLRRNEAINNGRSFNTYGGLTQLYASGTTDQIAFGDVGYDPIQDRALDTTERITSVAGGTSAYAASFIPVLGAAGAVPTGVLNPTVNLSRTGTANFSLPILDSTFTPNGRTIVSAAAQEQANLGRQGWCNCCRTIRGSPTLRTPRPAACSWGRQCIIKRQKLLNSSMERVSRTILLTAPISLMPQRAGMLNTPRLAR